jgi:hypothetical protein
VLDERIALKTLRPVTADDPKAVLRLKVEVQLARRVSHPHTCRIYDFAEWAMPDGHALQFLTMELIQGSTLGNKLRREGRVAPEEVLQLAEQLASGLDAVHRMGIVHRDFKSDNVMLHDASPLGLPLHAVIMDFGLARGLADRRVRLTSNSRALVGSAAYMAPEQVLGEELTPAADVYAFGVVLFELLTGTLPFAGDSPVAIAVQRLHKPAPRPSTLLKGLPGEWDELVGACLERQAANRLPNAGAVLRRLAAFRTGSVASVATVAVPPPRRRYGGLLGVLALGLAAWGGARACRHTEELRQTAARLEAQPASASSTGASVSSGAAGGGARPVPAGAPRETPQPAASAAPASAAGPAREALPGVSAPKRPKPSARESAAATGADVPKALPQRELPVAAAPEPAQQAAPPARPSSDPKDGFRW